MDRYRILRYVLPNFPETPQNEAAISNPDRDSNSDSSSISGVGSATGSTSTRNPTSRKFYFPDMRLDSEGNESPSDGSSSEEE